MTGLIDLTEDLAVMSRKRRGKKQGIREKGSGSIYQTKSGKYRVAVVLGRDPRTGRLRRKYGSAESEHEAVQVLHKMLPLAGNGFAAPPRDLTVGAWLRKYAKVRSEELRPRTRENYRHYLSRIEPILGDLPISRLSPLHILELYANLASDGLSPSVRQHIHHFLGGAFRKAVQLKVLSGNPMEAVDRPKSGKVVTARAWEGAEARQFLRAAEGHRLRAAFYLMLACGMRIGEVLALEWDDIEEGTLTVSRTMSVVGNRPSFGPPKTERGKRTIYLPSDVIRVLEKRRREQELERQIAETWTKTRLVFSSTVGTPLSPNNFRRDFRKLVKASGVPMIRVHDLRHTYITLARDAGQDAEVIADRVGQDVRVTMQIYSHVTESRKRKVAVSLNALLGNDRHD